MKKKGKFLLEVFILLLVFFSFQTSSSYDSATQNPEQSNLTPIAKIIITSDQDFGPAKFNFPGDGTPGNPYIIENFNVSSTGPYGILIEASEGFLPFNVSFIIRNCVVTAQEVCIKIIDAYPNLVKIENCVCSGTSQGDGIGIYLERCDGARLTGNTCKLNYRYGISVDLSSDILIENNTCPDNLVGILLDSLSNNNVLRQNTITSCVTGLYIEESHNNKLKYNVISDNFFGIFLYSSVLNEITNNNISYNGDAVVEGVGIVVSDSDNSVIKFNHFERNSAQAIAIAETSDNVLIHHNNFIQNGLDWGSIQCMETNGTDHIYARWYDIRTLEGNWWDDYGGTKPYLIGGNAGNIDPFPLSSMVLIEIIPTDELRLHIVELIVSLSIIGTAILMIRKKR